MLRRGERKYLNSWILIGDLTEEEFVKGCLIDDDLVELIDCRKGVRDQMVEEDDEE